MQSDFANVQKCAPDHNLSFLPAPGHPSITHYPPSCIPSLSLVPLSIPPIPPSIHTSRSPTSAYPGSSSSSYLSPILFLSTNQPTNQPTNLTSLQLCSLAGMLRLPADFNNTSVSSARVLAAWATLKMKIRGNFTSAESLFKEALSLDPEYVPALVNYANMLFFRVKDVRTTPV